MTNLSERLPCVVSVLGTDYRIEMRDYSEDKAFKDEAWAGYCSDNLKLIVVGRLSTFPNNTPDDGSGNEDIHSQYIGECATLRHELVHAFLNESGLRWDAGHFKDAWSKNEEMVDWIATQTPKMFEVFTYLGIM